MDSDDIRAAVAAGVLTESQALSLTALVDSRRGARTDLGGLDEPFELFKGFNEIFIVVGMGILFFAWWLISVPLAAVSSLGFSLGQTGLLAIGAGASLLLSGYFTLKRRMIAPSIFLVVSFAAFAIPAAFNLAWLTGLNFNGRWAFAFVLLTGALGAHYYAFRVPITSAGIVLSAYVALGFCFLANGTAIPQPNDLINLTSGGPFGWITLGLALLALSIALILDMSDPHRVTRRSRSAFWLHVVAAPAIINTLAITLLGYDTAFGQLALALVLLCLALFAVIIDRRSFLVAGIGYIVLLTSLVFDGDFAVPILILGAFLVFLGAKWEVLRGRLLRALPEFPGKSKLPPISKELL